MISDARNHARIKAEILRLCAARGPGKTMCPSEVARSLDGDEADWRILMPAVREAATELAKAGLVGIFQRGQPVQGHGFRGPIRLGAPRHDTTNIT